MSSEQGDSDPQTDAKVAAARAIHNGDDSGPHEADKFFGKPKPDKIHLLNELRRRGDKSRCDNWVWFKLANRLKSLPPEPTQKNQENETASITITQPSPTAGAVVVAISNRVRLSECV